MLALSANAKIFIYQLPISMQCSFEGLSNVIQSNFPAEVTSGAYFVFLNRRQDKIKVLYWDSDGLAIWYKRLEKGRFSRRSMESKIKIDRREFFMLLEGITPKSLNTRFRIS